jgi:hypothetical protein
VPATETTHSSLLFDDGPDSCPPHSAYINQLLIDRNYTPIFHMLEDYFDDQDAITHDELVRRIMLVNEPPQGMDNMIRVHGHLPPEERAEAELESKIVGYLMLRRMGFRVWLGTGVDEDSMTEGTAANKFRRALDRTLRVLACRPGTGDREMEACAESVRECEADLERAQQVHAQSVRALREAELKLEFQQETCKRLSRKKRRLQAALAREAWGCM